VDDFSMKYNLCPEKKKKLFEVIREREIVHN
jgi:hypothetical protein